MANYLLLYTGGGMPATEEESKKVLEQWGVWYGKLGDAVVDPGNPFAPMAMSIKPDGSVDDKPAGTMATGYTIVKADSFDKAVEIAKDCPVLSGGAQVSIYETFPVM